MIERMIDRPVLHFQPYFRTDLMLPCRITVVHGTPHHTLDDPVLTELIHTLDQRLDGGTVADDGCFICTVNNLIQFVCDNDGGQPVFLELHQKIQKHFRIFIIQRRCGLIQNQEFYIFGKCLCDFHQLLFAGPDVLDQSLGRFIKPYLLHMFFCFVVGPIPVDMPHFVLFLISQKHVLTDSQKRNQCQFLMNDDDSLCLAVLQSPELAKLPVIINFPCVATHRIRSGQHVHQCGFPRAVLADQRMNLPPLHDQIYIIQRFHSRELLGDGFHLQNNISQKLLLLSLSSLKPVSG